MRFLLSLAAVLSLACVAKSEDALDRVNAQRAARGLPAFVRDANLTAAAEACASHRATYLLFGHSANDFAFLPAGTSADAAGCAAYPSDYGFMACCTYESYRFAGAASVVGRDGKVYHHLFVSNRASAPPSVAQPPAASFAPMPTTTAPPVVVQQAPCAQSYAVSGCSSGRATFQWGIGARDRLRVKINTRERHVFRCR